MPWLIRTRTLSGESYTIRCDTRQQVAQDYHDLRARGREVEVLDQSGRLVALEQFGISEE